MQFSATVRRGSVLWHAWRNRPFVVGDYKGVRFKRVGIDFFSGELGDEAITRLLDDPSILLEMAGLPGSLGNSDAAAGAGEPIEALVAPPVASPAPPRPSAEVVELPRMKAQDGRNFSAPPAAASGRQNTPSEKTGKRRR